MVPLGCSWRPMIATVGPVSGAVRVGLQRQVVGLRVDVCRHGVVDRFAHECREGVR